MTTREKAKAFLPLIQAWSEGKTLQMCCGGQWMDIETDDLLRWFGGNWEEKPESIRVKSEPREFWITKHDGAPFHCSEQRVFATRYEVILPCAACELIHVKEVL